MWTVIMEPVAADPSRDGYNRGGVHVLITDGTTKSHIGRVAYARWATPRRFVTFKCALKVAIRRAEAEAAALNI
jgi:hypothetical protein